MFFLSFLRLELEDWNLEFICYLVLGIWNFRLNQLFLTGATIWVAAGASFGELRFWIIRKAPFFFLTVNGEP
jgi:hypothetical protein